MAELSNKTLAMLIENNHNDHEVWYPIYRFREAGADVRIIGPAAQQYISKLGQSIDADQAADAAQDKLFDD